MFGRKNYHENKLTLKEAALDILCDLDGPIAVCVCVGQYRSGKSFLLNKTVWDVINKSSSLDML